MMQGSLAEQLRVLRAREGLTLTEASERIGITRHTLRSLERGGQEPHYPTLRKIADGYGVAVEELLEEPVAAGKAEAPEAGPAGAEQPPLNGWVEEDRAQNVPEWLTEALDPGFESAGEALDEYCKEWAERQQRGELDLDAIERFFEDVERWDFVVGAAVSAEALELIRSGQVSVDPNMDPNDPGDMIVELLESGKLGSAWSRWMGLQNEFLAEAKALQLDAKVLERIEKEAEERRAAFSALPGGGQLSA